MPSGPGVWVIGGGGHAKMAIATLRAAGHTVLGVFDDDPARWGATLLGCAILGAVPDTAWWRAQDGRALLAVGSNTARRALADRLPADRWTVAIDPSATVHDSASIGPGTLVAPQAVINPDAAVGPHVIVNTAAVIEHDCRIGAFAHLAPRSCLAGGAAAGEGAFVGAGATVIPGVAVGAWSTVGAGAAVVRDVPAGVTAVGVPARPATGGQTG